MTKEELEELKDKIKTLEKKYKNTYLKYKREKIRCNITKIKALTKLGFIFLPIPIVGTVMTTISGWNPFKINEKQIPTIITTTIDMDGTLTQTREYKIERPYKYSDTYQFSELYYYTPWEEKNEKYERTIYVYSLKIEEETIAELIKTIKEIQPVTLENVENIFSKLIVNYNKTAKNKMYSYIIKEKYNSITQEQKLEQDHLGMKLEKIDKNDKLIINETIEEHITVELIKILIEIGLMLPQIIILFICTNFFKKIKEQLKNNVSNEELEKLKNQLKTKKMKYNIYKEKVTEKQKTAKKVM